MIKRYEDCISCLETRAGHPPTREFIDHLIEGLKTSGIDSIWHSAVDPRAIPLFPSKVFPVHHPEANAEIFHELVSRVHALGRTIMCWYPLHLCKSLLTVHPEWRLQYYDFDSGDPAKGDPPQDVICPSTPYRELLPQFMAEVTREFDFDGFWLDGTIFSLHWGTFSPGCKCPWCRERFKRETGLDLPAPETINKNLVTDPVAKRWIKWRYDVLMDLWKGCVDAVVAVKPSATVAINNLRHRDMNGWNLGIPLRTLGFDSIMSTETCTFPAQADVQMKLQKAYRCRRGVDTWQALSDHGYTWSSDMETLTFTQALLATISAGGDKTPVGSDCDIRAIAAPLRELHELIAPRALFKGGETVEYAAILASQQTEDYYVPLSRHGVSWHGANELCRHAHLQSSILFDDYIDRGDLAGYPVILLGNAACLSVHQAQQLERYVTEGGVLFACHEVGTRDEWGEVREKPVLDELLGIHSRGGLAPAVTARVVDAGLLEVCGEMITFVNGATIAEPTPDCRVLAQAVPPGITSAYPQKNTWSAGLSTFTGVSIKDEATGARIQGVRPLGNPSALWTRPVGKGYVIYLGAELCHAYLSGPTTRMARLFRYALTHLRTPRVTLTGPTCVSVNTRIQADGRWAVHVHNAPGGLYRYPQPSNANYLHGVGEVVPVHDLLIHLAGGQILSACSGVSGRSFSVEDGSRVTIPKLDLHDVVLLRLKT
jgi:hypothetical protein